MPFPLRFGRCQTTRAERKPAPVVGGGNAGKPGTTECHDYFRCIPAMTSRRQSPPLMLVPDRDSHTGAVSGEYRASTKAVMRSCA